VVLLLLRTIREQDQGTVFSKRFVWLGMCRVAQGLVHNDANNKANLQRKKNCYLLSMHIKTANKQTTRTDDNDREQT
jgi:hypothetical protein